MFQDSLATKVFTDNAFLFYANSKYILADSRMSLSTVDVDNGLAYTGSFRRSTLGAYIELWGQCSGSRVIKKDEEWLVWLISGSPLSGINRCGIVNSKGQKEYCEIIDFHMVWKSFISINTRYNSIESDLTPLPLEEVVNILRGRNYLKQK